MGVGERVQCGSGRLAGGGNGGAIFLIFLKFPRTIRWAMMGGGAAPAEPDLKRSAGKLVTTSRYID